MSIILNRRSIRQYKDMPVEKDKLTRIIKAGMQAPSAHNTQPWEFILITDAKAKEALSQMSQYAQFAKAAPVLILTCANLDRAAKDNTWWVQDLSACTQNMLLQIAAEGLGGVWLGFYPDEERVSKAKAYFTLPEHIVPFSVIACGYSEQPNQFVDRYDAAKVHYEAYDFK